MYFEYIVTLNCNTPLNVILLSDQLAAHMSVLKELNALDDDVLFVPLAKKNTGAFQPCDQGIIKNVRDKLRTVAVSQSLNIETLPELAQEFGDQALVIWSDIRPLIFMNGSRPFV